MRTADHDQSKRICSFMTRDRQSTQGFCNHESYDPDKNF
jgi:hypothetical protein